MKKKLEVLAPCGNMENFNIAINAGADAVYLGLDKFNARIKAGNFNSENLPKVVETAHLHNVKVYLTINTLIKNKEFTELIDVLRCAVDSKVDAFIVQDLGVAYLLKKCFPNVVLHASTQMGIHNLYGAKVLEKLGFSRVILARETKLEDIKLIKDNTNLEIEYFVHGALCVSFSGNCYFSSMCTGESGNRGKCKQLCRLKYKAICDDKITNLQYLLSPRDICLINNLNTLIEAGVTSFKIEGRLKRGAYVAQTVASYHKVLEVLSSNYNVSDKNDICNNELNLLRKSFSRGNFNDNAYLSEGVPNEIINKKIQNHIGEKIGKVIYCKPFKNIYEVTIQSDHKIIEGDALKFLDGLKQIDSCGVGNVICVAPNKYKIFSKHNVVSNLDVYLTIDSAADNKVLEIKNPIMFMAKIIAKENEKLRLKFFNDFACVEVESEYVCPTAINKPTDFVEISTQIKKTDDEDLLVEKVECDIDKVFIPKSVINELRRNGIQKFKKQTIANYNMNITAKIDEVQVAKVITNMQTIDLPINNNDFVVVKNYEQLEKYYRVGGSKKDFVIFSPEIYRNNVVIDFLKKVKLLNKNCVLGLDLPIIANYADLKLIDEIVINNKELFLVANNYYGLKYIYDGFKVYAGTGLNVFNSLSMKHLCDIGVEGIFASIEIDKSNLPANNQIVLYSVGYFPVMNFCHCPYKTVNDNNCSNCSCGVNMSYQGENGEEYRVVRKKVSQCYFELLNSKMINILNRHDCNMLIDLKYLDNDEISKVVESILTNSKLHISSSDSMGMFLKEVE